MVSTQPEFEAKMTQLRLKYQAQLRGQIETLRGYKNIITAPTTTPADLELIRLTMHNIAGSAGSYGFHDVTTYAHTLEQLIHSGDSTAIAEQADGLLDRLMDACQSAVEQP